MVAVFLCGSSVAWSVERGGHSYNAVRTGSSAASLSPKEVECTGLSNLECEKKLEIDMQWTIPSAKQVELWTFYVTGQSGTTLQATGLSPSEQQAIQLRLNQFLEKTYQSEIYCLKKEPKCQPFLPTKLGRILFQNGQNGSGNGHFSIKVHNGKLPVLVVGYGAKFPQDPNDYVTYALAVNVHWGPKPMPLQAAPIKPKEQAAIVPYPCPSPISPLTMEDLSYQKIKGFLAKNPDVNTVSALLSCLPTELFSLYAAVHTSASPEAADIFSEYPRILLTTPDGRLTLSFTGFPKGKDYKTIRFLEFSPQENRFHLHKLTFSADQDKPQYEENPAGCVACHSATGNLTDVKPIWNRYFAWHNAYGSHSDSNVVGWRTKPANLNGYTFVPDKEQYQQFKQFLLQRQDSSRYQWLIDPLMSQEQLTNEFLASDEMNPKKPTPPPNRKLGYLWGQLNAKRIATKLLQNSEFVKYRFRFLSALLGCEMTPAWKQKFKATFSAIASVKPYYDHYLELEDPGQWPGNLQLYGRYSDWRRYALIGVLSGYLGVSYNDWDMAVFPDPNDSYMQQWHERGPGFLFGTPHQDYYVLLELIPSYQDTPSVHDSLGVFLLPPPKNVFTLSQEMAKQTFIQPDFTTQCQAIGPYVDQEVANP